MSRAVKKLRPELPIVFGGWHPSLAVEQTLREDFVDAVVRGQGELTFLELVQRIADGHDWHGVQGLSFKDQAEIVHEPARPVANINDLPAPAYDLVDHGIYAATRGFASCLTPAASDALTSAITARIRSFISAVSMPIVPNGS